jgi:hypothetical protein
LKVVSFQFPLLDRFCFNPYRIAWCKLEWPHGWGFKVENRHVLAIKSYAEAVKNGLAASNHKNDIFFLESNARTI